MTAEAVYDQAHVCLQELLGRTYNNPLGEAPFPLLRAVLGTWRPLRVLDAGCGRGQTALWWAAHAGASVDAFDPSPTMLASARHLVSQEHLEDRVRLHEADIAGFCVASEYDLVISHDVLCYSNRLTGDLARLLAMLRPGGVASLTSYYCEDATDEMRTVVDRWGIQPPSSFEQVTTLLNVPGFQVLLLVDTTRQYRAHWSAVRERLSARRDDAQRGVGAAATAAFGARIDAILNAVRGGHFGHWWAVLRRKE